MAISATLKQHKLDGNWAPGLSSFAMTAFTPAANSLLLFLMGGVDVNSGTPMQSGTVAGGSLSWSRITYANTTGWKGCATAWYALVGGSPASTTVTWTAAGSAYLGSASAGLWEITGHDTGTPIGGSASAANQAGDGAVSLTLSAAPASGDYTFALVHVDAATSGTYAVTPGSTFTEAGDTYSTATAIAAETQIQTRTGSTSTTCDWVDVQTGTGTTYSSGVVGVVAKVASSSFMPSRRLLAGVPFSQSRGMW